MHSLSCTINSHLDLYSAVFLSLAGLECAARTTTRDSCRLHSIHTRGRRHVGRFKGRKVGHGSRNSLEESRIVASTLLYEIKRQRAY